MRHCFILLSVVLLTSALPSYAQDNAAAERARLANERIRAEMEAKAKEEEERRRNAMQAAPEAPLSEVRPAPPRQPVTVMPPTQSEPELAQAAPVEPLPTPEPAIESPQSTSVEKIPAPATRPAPPRTPSLTPTALDQLQKLGELLDAGYLTEAEFERIKMRILEQNF
ncbi:MAG: SHOCT domain-containing protein [Pseudomonadota bacterium]